MTNSELTIKRYQNVDDFLLETESQLQQQEIKNTFVLTTAHQALKDERNCEQINYYCGAIWDQDKLLFAIFALDQEFLFASILFDDEKSEALKLLVDDVLDSFIEIQGLHGYQPVLNQIKSLLEKDQQTSRMKFEDSNANEAKKVIWSTLSLQIAQTDGNTLRIANIHDFPLIKVWTAGLF
jgi:hypothetical protein